MLQFSDVISTLALIFSLLTFFWVNLRKAKFACAPVRALTIDVSETEEDRLVPSVWIKVLLAITNYGGSSGVIESLGLHLRVHEKKNVAIEFLAHTELSQQDMLEKPPKSQTPVLPSPFALAPGESVIRHVWFMCAQPQQHTLKPDTYDLRIYARVLGRKKEVLLRTQRLIVRRELAPNYNIAHWVLRDNGQIEIG